MLEVGNYVKHKFIDRLIGIIEYKEIGEFSDIMTYHVSWKTDKYFDNSICIHEAVQLEYIDDVLGKQLIDTYKLNTTEGTV